VARSRALEGKLARLSELRDEEDSEPVRRELVNNLDDKSPHVVARAATVIGELGIGALAPEVESSIERFFREPEKSDKGCIAKTAIIRCLSKLEEGSQDVFVRSLRHVQLEPAYGGPVDTAVELRCESALGLVATGYMDIVNDLVAAMTDKEAPVRLAAVRALAATGRAEVEALLRFKVLTGDADVQVVSDALESLLVIAPHRSVPLAEQFLDSSDDALAEVAALALGGSRCEEAFELLTSRLGDFDSRLTETMLLAVSMLRREESFAYLLSSLKLAPHKRAEKIIKALAIHRYDSMVRERVENAVTKRNDKKVLLSLCAIEFDR
jgi:HEAT repeat protein